MLCPAPRNPSWSVLEPAWAQVLPQVQVQQQSQ
jgi:hypothetical protein